MLFQGEKKGIEPFSPLLKKEGRGGGGGGGGGSQISLGPEDAGKLDVSHSMSSTCELSNP